MKEYLDSAKNYMYVQDIAKRSEDWIEIPEGAEAYGRIGAINTFYKDVFSKFANENNSFEWEDRSKWAMRREREILWQRPTQPEELPFVDDGPMTEENQIPVDATEIMNKFRAGNIKLDFSQSTGISGLDRPQSELAEIEKVRQSQWAKQVGGNHYKSMKIQPAQFALENKLDYCQANAIKYICRHEHKNGKEDLEKAKHYIDLLIEHYYG